MHLDSKQMEIVNSNEPQILVIAGSGSGKTRVLTERIKRLINDGVPTDGIVVITFTNAAADEIKERLEYVGEAFIGTIHGYANRILLRNGINTKVIVPDKNSGVYNVVFFSIYDENNCELEISYMDDNGSKYSPEIYECKINGVPTKVEDGIIKDFKIEKDKKYIVSLKTNLRDFYTCEVKIYANR